MIISFSFLSLINSDYKGAIKKFNKLTGNHHWIHFDVMDGKFVSNSTYDYTLLNNINDISKSFNDVHLMINNPSENIQNYVDAGADQITFHYESVDVENINEIINKIKKYNVKVGISIKPNTDIRVLDDYLKNLDYVLIMSVEPGKGGQQFMESSLDKIKYLKDKQNQYNYLIGVDGGINDNTFEFVKDAGADVVIIGSYLSSNLNKETIEKFK